MREPTWLDLLIMSHIGTSQKATPDTAAAIAQSIATSPQIIEAIQQALDKPQHVELIGISKAQAIGDAVIAALQPIKQD